MSISIWDLFKYLFKWKIFIVTVTVAAFFLAGVYVDTKQTYSARVVIQYNDSCISQGKTLDGQLFDVNEIKSPQVILDVLDDLGYSSKKIESIRERITISSITPKTVENLKNAKEKLGEEYKFFPKTFTIAYKGGASVENTRDILSSLVKNYFEYYSQTYLYLATLNEVDYNINKKNFDYLEQAEQIEANLKQTITALTNYSKDSTGYRSPSTGLTFDDLCMDFERIDEYKMPIIFSKIFEGQVTQNEGLLINKYEERLERNNIEKENAEYKAALAKARMESYASASEGIPDTEALTALEKSVIQGVEFDENNAVNEQTTYDNLISSYANDCIAANSKQIDMEYCQKVIDTFRQGRSPELEAYEEEVKTEIDRVLSDLSELYKKANMTISDYNTFIPSTHIKKLSGVSYYENISGSVYKLIALIGAFGMSCMTAIVYEVMKKYAAYSAETGDDDDGEKESDEEES